MDAVNRGDMETAQRMVDEAAEKAGYEKNLYHQTGNSFTQFNTDNQSAGKYDYETPTGIFLKPDDRDIGLKGKQQMSLLANMQNPLHFADRNSISYFWKKTYLDTKRLYSRYLKMTLNFNLCMMKQIKETPKYTKKHGAIGEKVLLTI